MRCGIDCWLKRRVTALAVLNEQRVVPVNCRECSPCFISDCVCLIDCIFEAVPWKNVLIRKYLIVHLASSRYFATELQLHSTQVVRFYLPNFKPTHFFHTPCPHYRKQPQEIETPLSLQIQNSYPFTLKNKPPIFHLE